MPRLKPVASLQTMAMDVFFEFVVQFCNRLNATGDISLFRSGILAIRDQIHSRLPDRFFVEFATKFLNSFSLTTRRQLSYEIALEMLMDVEIPGLRLGGPNLQYLDPQKGHRFQTFEELDLTPVILRRGQPMFRFLHEYHLNDLVTFEYPRFCTDDDLRIIGKNCPKLEVVRVTNSDYVTDQGLQGLSPCSNLRVAYFRRCCKVSHIGFNYLLSTHDKLEDFYYCYDCHSDLPRIDDKLDQSSGLDLSVKSSSLNRLVFESYWNGEETLDVQSIVTKFPNLTYLKINCKDTWDLPVLKHQNSLTGLEINYVNGMNDDYEEPILEYTWEDIEEIFSFIGANITTLTLCAIRQHFRCTQQELNMIYNGCPNLEHLDFDHPSCVYVVPEFKKLKVLTPRAPCCVRRWREDYNLEFGRMENLEILTLPYLGLDLKHIKAIMFDDYKFPKLSVLRMSTWRLEDDVLPEINRIAKDSNIDFRVDVRDQAPRCDDYPPQSDDSDDSEIHPKFKGSRDTFIWTI